MNPQVFREYDVRGIVGSDLDDDFVRDLGRAIGTYAGAHGVTTMAVGRDTRISSEAFQGLMIAGITSTGIDVTDIGLCATPILYFAIRHLHAGGGVMVTGSHNPPEFNGFKICVGPDTIYGEEIQKLRHIIEDGDYRKGAGTVKTLDLTQVYQDYLFDNVKVKAGLRIAVDGGNGVGGHFALPLFERFGCTVTPLYCDMDGTFPNHFPDPTVEENIADLIAVVRDQGLDAGIAFDGDADRIGVVTDRGDILWGDQLLILFSRDILQEHPGAVIIGEVKCSQNLYDDIERNGGKGIMWKAGHSLIKGKMKEEQALLAGEMSGHLFFADRYFGFDDAIYAAARLLEILTRTGKTLSDMLSGLPQTFNTPEIRVDCPDALKFQVVEKVKEHFREGYQTVDIDGIRVQFDNGWGLVRASNTQPVLVLRFESLTRDGLDSIRKRVESVVEDCMKETDTG